MSVPIGLLDSGLGGFSIYYGLKQVFPDAPLIGLADQANSPYGPKTIEELEAITIANIEILQSYGCEHILFACNTTSALVLESMQKRFPHLQLKGVIDGTVAQVSPVQSIAVVATLANINSHVYKQKLQRKFPDMEVIEIVAHDLVDFIESMADESTIRAYITQLLKQAPHVEALILGCTHYPLVKHLFSQVKPVIMYDSIEAMVLELTPWLDGNVGASHVLTTKDAPTLKHQLYTLFNKEEVVIKVGD
jgi:glutamate racemase